MDYPIIPDSFLDRVDSGYGYYLGGRVYDPFDLPIILPCDKNDPAPIFSLAHTRVWIRTGASKLDHKLSDYTFFSRPKKLRLYIYHRSNRKNKKWDYKKLLVLVDAKIARDTFTWRAKITKRGLRRFCLFFSDPSVWAINNILNMGLFTPY